MRKRTNTHLYCFISKLRGQAELRSAFWLVSWAQIPQKTFGTMIGDMINTFRNATSAVNQEFVQKIQIETSICHETLCSQ